MTPSDSLLLRPLLHLCTALLGLPLTLQLIILIFLPNTIWGLYNYNVRHRGIPGPLHARLGVPFYLAWRAFRLDWVWYVQHLHEQYGSVVRIAPNQIDFSSPTALQTIFSYSSSTYLKPKSFYDGFVVFKNNPSLFSDTDPHSHAQRRRGVSAAYALNYLVKLEDCVDPMVDRLIRRIRAKIQHGEPSQDLTKMFHFFAMDAVGELAFGQNFGFLKSLEDSGRFLRGVTNHSQWGGAFGYLPSITVSLWRKVFKHILKEPGPEVISSSTQNRIHRRFALLAEGKEPLRTDMLSKFLEAKNPDGSPCSSAQVTYIASSVIAAGSDTTSLALAAILRYLVANPKCYARAQEEVDEAFESRRLTEPCLYAAAVKLDYLQACVKEALRLHPPISMSLPRLVPPGGDVIDGHFYPGGTIVSISPFVIHRDPSLWGADANLYRPERWIDDIHDESDRKTLERNFFAFGGGSRACIGKNISLMEITKTLPRLLWHFHFTTIRGNGRIGRDSDGSFGEEIPWLCTSSWFLNAENLWMDVSLRRSDDEQEEEEEEDEEE